MNKKTLTILGIAILVVIAIGFWFVQNKKSIVPVKIEIQEETNIVVDPQVKPEDDKGEDVIANENQATSKSEEKILYNPDGTIDTSNWQIYRNEEYGFEFKYPNYLEMEKYEKNEYKDSIFTVLFRSEDSGSILLKVKNESFNPKSIKGIHGSLINEEKIKVDVLNDFTIYSYKSGDAGCFGDIINIPKKDVTIVLSIIDCVESENKLLYMKKEILNNFILFIK